MHFFYQCSTKWYFNTTLKYTTSTLRLLSKLTSILELYFLTFVHCIRQIFEPVVVLTRSSGFLLNNKTKTLNVFSMVDLLKIKEELSKQRDKLLSEVVTLRENLTEATSAQQEIESEKNKAMETIAQVLHDSTL